MKPRNSVALYLTVLTPFLFSSCSNDESSDKLYSGGRKQIGFSISGMNSTRSSHAYETGLDISDIRISSWKTKSSSVAPSYGIHSQENGSYFHNALLSRSTDSYNNCFSFYDATYYWPENGENLDFFAVARLDGSEHGDFRFDNTPIGDEGYIPGLDWIHQQDVDGMSDIFWAYSFDKKSDPSLSGNSVVNLDFRHALAKVVVTAEVRNRNLRVYITDVDLCGLMEKGKFNFPYKSADGGTVTLNDASWQYDPEDAMEKIIHCPVKLMKNGGEGLVDGTVVLDTNTDDGFRDGFESSENGNMSYAGTKHTLVGANSQSETGGGDLFVLPYDYKGRNDGDEIKTYIRVKCQVYNKSGETFSQHDTLIFPRMEDGAAPEGQYLYIPVEFDFRMGKMNVYNIFFDSGVGGLAKLSRQTPGLVKIGYEANVDSWK